RDDAQLVQRIAAREQREINIRDGAAIVAHVRELAVHVRRDHVGRRETQTDGDERDDGQCDQDFARAGHAAAAAKRMPHAVCWHGACSAKSMLQELRAVAVGAAKGFFEDEIFASSAALAYYSLLSMA